MSSTTLDNGNWFTGDDYFFLSIYSEVDIIKQFDFKDIGPFPVPDIINVKPYRIELPTQQERGVRYYFKRQLVSSNAAEGFVATPGAVPPISSPMKTVYCFIRAYINKNNYIIYTTGLTRTR